MGKGRSELPKRWIFDRIARELALAVARQDPPSGFTPDEGGRGGAGRARFDRRHLHDPRYPLRTGRLKLAHGRHS